MFTGIITHLGTIKDKTQEQLIISVPADLKKKLIESSSIAVNGVCLTITTLTTHGFHVDVMPETWKKTALSDLQPRNLVNLELPLAASALLAGHIVQGHVDGTGTITSISPEGNSRLFTIGIDPDLADLCVEKGSIAVNGISLTLIDVQRDFVTIGIIPYTWEHTMLHSATIGMRVNIEIDILAKYVYRLLQPYKKETKI